MIGVDTNVLVRFYIKDEQQQYKRVHQLFRNADHNNPICINLVVLMEWFWVLTEIYGVSKTDILKELEYLLGSKEIVLENSADVRKASQLFKNQNADFEDCLIGILNRSKNCESTYTFDKAASNLTSFTLLK